MPDERAIQKQTPAKILGEPVDFGVQVSDLMAICHNLFSHGVEVLGVSRSNLGITPFAPSAIEKPAKKFHGAAFH